MQGVVLGVLVLGVLVGEEGGCAGKTLTQLSVATKPSTVTILVLLRRR